MARKKSPAKRRRRASNPKTARERAEFLALLLDAVEQAVIATDRVGVILYWNRFAQRLYGWRADEVLGKNIADVLLPEESRDFGRAAISNLPDGRIGDWLLRRRDGRMIQVHAVPTSMVDKDGNVLGIVGVSWDNSEKKRLEEKLHQSEIRLRFILEQIPGMAWATDADLRIVWNDGAAFRTAGMTPSVFLGKTLLELERLGEGHAEAISAHKRALTGKTSAFEEDWRGMVLHAVVQPLRDPVGRIAGTVGISLDVTERKRIERELNDKGEQLQALTRRLLDTQERERRALARELHDDFGQFLTALRLNLEAARRAGPSDWAQRLCESVALVDQAVDRVRRIALDLRPSILDDLGLVAALRSLLARQTERAGLEGRLAVGPLHKRFDASLETCLFRLVQEALTNVVRHAGARRVDVELGVEGGELCVVVRDDGRGFDVAAAHREATRGTSIGILSMRERVTLAGGRFEIRSVAKRGTTVAAFIPLAAGSGASSS